MTAPAVDLQRAIYDLLIADPGVSAIVGSRVLDNVDEMPQFPYITFGASDGYEEDADCIPGSVETIQIDGWTRDNARLSGAKALCYAIRRAVKGASLDLGAHAAAVANVDLWRVFRDADGKTGHAVVQVTVTIEEADGD